MEYHKDITKKKLIRREVCSTRNQKKIKHNVQKSWEKS